MKKNNPNLSKLITPMSWRDNVSHEAFKLEQWMLVVTNRD